MPRASKEQKARNYDNGPKNVHRASKWEVRINGRIVMTQPPKSRKNPPTLGW